MDTYYDLVQRASDLLANDGFDAASREVLVAERSATTSGEAISGIGAVLTRVLSFDLPAETRAAVSDALAEGERLWDESNQ